MTGIIRAGAINSPQLLTLSGIGPVDQLAQLSIPVVAASPAVGTLVDHPSVDLFFKDDSKLSFQPYAKPSGLGDICKILAQAWKYFVKEEGGALASTAGQGVAFIRTDDPTLFPQEKFREMLTDSTSSKDGPDVELFSSPVCWLDHGRDYLSE